MADDKVRASSSSSSLFTLNLPNGLEEREQIGRVAEKHVRHLRANQGGENPGSYPRQEGEMGRWEGRQSKEGS